MIFVYITFGVVLLWALLTGNLWNIIVGAFHLGFIIALVITALIYWDEIVGFLTDAETWGAVFGLLMAGALFVGGGFLVWGIHYFWRWLMGRPPPNLGLSAAAEREEARWEAEIAKIEAQAAADKMEAQAAAERRAQWDAERANAKKDSGST
jgi:hypothetical protein